MREDVLLEVKDLRTYFDTDAGLVKAVDGITFHINREEVLGVVGESGCGKSVTAQSIMALIPRPGRVVSGNILYNTGSEVVDIAALRPNSKKMREIRGKEISMIFQEPMTSLNPVYTIGQQIAEAITTHENVSKQEAREKTIELLRQVGIPMPERRVDQYPHELSGGMRQRVIIAMAISCSPQLLIADEPTTALDVTIQAQILYLLKRMQQSLNSAIMFITHDLGVINQLADRVVVMYAGKIVETGVIEDIFDDTKHPYTKGLLASVPVIGRKQRLYSIPGSVPNLYDLPKGCYFAPRCSEAMDICRKEEPPAVTISESHVVNCWRYK